ncbi:electron transfer flavoprotein subunit alpha/FixB family protein [Actinotalea ferrariae]|uniref:electron transfer flavoprotein subunit alpha/FixB family protein n=1 Tax=Actinotalea ferrariae TaxID=1386098 RepID=UPI001C8CB992|nr:electron transfer flavoprotein subunit alpha/FixB family protein [Actinotalea ferrariae]MBX9245534.1 electron transfer flavoprotein subunit alpha/FixB family protein [Actinotalea ferrariae]
MTDPTPAPVLVVVDHHGDAPRSSAYELLTAGRALGPLEAVWIGTAPDAAVERLGAWGVTRVHELPEAADLLPPERGEALAAVVEATGAATVLLASTFENKETAARLALATGAGLMVDCAALEAGPEGRPVAVQQAFAATWTLRAQATVPRVVAALKPNAVQAVAPEGVGAVSGRPEVVRHDVAPAQAPAARLVERTPRAASDRPDLGEAQVVVVGGRGTNGDFSPVEDLADALGGAVGATRVATDEGWIGHEAQIGQTGVTISPRLYIGAGVSGAVHHRGGMQSSGTIVAVNSDPESPIFEIADFGVVGDLFTVLPQAAAEIRRVKQG